MDELLRDEVWKSILDEIVHEPTGSASLAAFLISEVEPDLSTEFYSSTIGDFYAFLFEASYAMLLAVGEIEGLEINTTLLKRISRTFLTFDEPWEEYLKLQDFALYAKQLDTTEDLGLSPVRKLLVTYVLARSSEELPAVRAQGLNFFNVAVGYLNALKVE